MLRQVQQHWLIYMIIMCLSDTGVIVAVVDECVCCWSPSLRELGSEKGELWKPVCLIYVQAAADGYK